jgi:predicted DCC family thiol-disulfide oxidoreductase YuxK
MNATAAPANTHTESSSTSHAVMLFDGVCNLCNGTVQFVIKHDPAAYFHFASLQSEAAQHLLDQYQHHDRELSSVLLIEGGTVYSQSDAALRIVRRLGPPWQWLWPLRWLPRLLRDGVYRLVANNRYRLFGKQEDNACWLPTPELKARFLR